MPDLGPFWRPVTGPTSCSTPGARPWHAWTGATEATPPSHPRSGVNLARVTTRRHNTVPRSALRPHMRPEGRALRPAATAMPSSRPRVPPGRPCGGFPPDQTPGTPPNPSIGSNRCNMQFRCIQGSTPNAPRDVQALARQSSSPQKEGRRNDVARNCSARPAGSAGTEASSPGSASWGPRRAGDGAVPDCRPPA